MIYDPCHAAGSMTLYEWRRDPKRIGFILARYKFVAKMLEGRKNVLEVGCADGFGSRVVRQHVARLTAVDIDAASIGEAQGAAVPEWPIDFFPHDILHLALPGFDAVYALDVLEHMDPVLEERRFMEHLRVCAPVAIIGCPSLESQQYASELSKQGHINCKTGEAFRETMLQYWNNVFLFGMNDETLHTGFSPMAQYRFAICT